LLSFAHAQSEGDFKFKSVNDLTLTRINNDFHSESFLTKLAYDFDSGWKVSLLNEFFYDDRGVPGLGEFQQPNATQKDARNLTSVNISKEQFIRPELDLNITLFNRFDYLKFTNPTPTTMILITPSALHTAHLQAMKSRYLMKYCLLTRLHDWTFGQLIRKRLLLM